MKHTYINLRQIRSSLGEKVSFSTLRKWIHSGRLPGYYAGGRIVVREKDLLDFLKPVPVGSIRTKTDDPSHSSPTPGPSN